MTAYVLYLGDRSGTSLQRANAFRRLGLHIFHISPRDLLPKSALIDRIEWHIAPRMLAQQVCRKILAFPEIEKVDWVWVDSGSLISRELLDSLRAKGKRIVNFNHDDPYGQRDWTRFKEYRRAVLAYDLVLVVREPNVQEAMSLGAKDVMLVTRTADEVAHVRREITALMQKKWVSEVSFIGTWMPERGPFLSRLVERGVPLSIFGGGWHKAHEWGELKRFHRQNHLDGDDYAYAVQCSKISLGLLSKGNRDLHTTRSIEIPMLGGLLCAERTIEHLAMYEEGFEAIFWRNADECADKCLALLEAAETRARIALAGHQRVLLNGNTSEGLIKKVIERLGV